MSYYFCIVGTRDNLLFEADLSPISLLSSETPKSGWGDDQQRHSSVFGFTNALGQWTSGFPLRPASSATQEAVKDETKLTTASSFTNERQLLQMIAHGSLDSLEDCQFLDSNMYAHAILTQLPEKHGPCVRLECICISCAMQYVRSSYTDIKFILLHQHKHEEGIRLFLMDVWELWVKVRPSYLPRSL